MSSNDAIDQYGQSLGFLGKLAGKKKADDKWARSHKRHISWKKILRTDKPWGNRVDKRGSYV